MQAIFRSLTNPVQVARIDWTLFDKAQVKAMACEVVAETEEPLSRQSIDSLTQRAQEILDKPISRTTVWEWLDEAGIKPWQYEYWVYPRLEGFAERAGPVLDLYEGHFEGEPLKAGDFVISADEKTSIQARKRVHSGQPPGPKRPARVEHEYERKGARQYLAAWDVHQGQVFGRTEEKNGIDPFMRLAEQVMSREPYASADQVFWIVDNGSAHRGQTSIERMKSAWPNAILLHTPVHASWLNQIEIYFSILQRKVLTPNQFESVSELSQTLAKFEERVNAQAKVFNWGFTRSDMKKFLKKLERHQAA